MHFNCYWIPSNETQLKEIHELYISAFDHKKPGRKIAFNLHKSAIWNLEYIRSEQKLFCLILHLVYVRVACMVMQH